MGEPDYPCPDQWEYGTERQKQRCARTQAELRKRYVPTFCAPLMVDDEEQVEAQPAEQVVHRIMAMWTIALVADGVDLDDLAGYFERFDFWRYLTDGEKQFLTVEERSVEMCRPLVWLLEDIWVLLWALGYPIELDWPHRQCDVEALTKYIGDLERRFDRGELPSVRSKSEILDAHDLTMRIEWAVRDACLNRGGVVPEDLDWKHPNSIIPISHSHGAAVVHHRHQALSWLTSGLEGSEYDSADTST